MGRLPRAASQRWQRIQLLAFPHLPPMLGFAFLLQSFSFAVFQKVTSMQQDEDIPVVPKHFSPL